jgi:hypothetical protein
MRYLIALIALLSLAAACGGDDDGAASLSAPATATAKPTRTPLPTPAPPEVLAAVPEGRLVVGGTATFAISGDEAARLPDGEVFPSPEGTAAAFVRAGVPNAWDAIGVLSNGELQIIEEWDDLPWYPSVVWDRDGSRFAYAIERTASTGSEPTDIWVVNADGSGRTRFASAPGAVPFGWAADGRLIAWVNTGYALVSADGAPEAMAPLPEDRAFAWSISPDGTRIAVTAGYTEGQPGVEVMHFSGLWVYDIGAAEYTRVADMSMTVRRPTAFVSADASLARARKGPPPVAWSPAGDSIVFTKAQFDAGTNEYTSELWIVYLEPGYPSERLAGEVYQPQWSADGSFVSYIGEDGIAGYYRPRGAGETLTYAAATGGATSTAWTASGRLVTCGANGVSIYDPASGQATNALDAAGGQVFGAHITDDSAWSPSGRYVAFEIGGTEAGVYMLDTETASLTRVIAGAGYLAVAWVG